MSTGSRMALPFDSFATLSKSHRLQLSRKRFSKNIVSVDFPTWILPSSTPLDEANDEKDEDDEGDGAHQTDEPALRGNVHTVRRDC